MNLRLFPMWNLSSWICISMKRYQQRSATSVWGEDYYPLWSDVWFVKYSQCTNILWSASWSELRRMSLPFSMLVTFTADPSCDANVIASPSLSSKGSFSHQSAYRNDKRLDLFLDLVYLRHLSAEYRVTLLVSMSTECRPSVGWHVIEVGSLSVATIGRHLVSMLVDTRPTPWPLRYDQLSVAYRSTVTGISVHCRWYIGQLSRVYWSTFTGIVCIFCLIVWNGTCLLAPPSYPQGTWKKRLYRLCPHVDWARIQFKQPSFPIHIYCNLRSEQILSRKWIIATLA